MKASRFCVPLILALFVLTAVGGAPGDDLTAVGEPAVYSNEPFLALVGCELVFTPLLAVDTNHGNMISIGNCPGQQ